MSMKVKFEVNKKSEFEYLIWEIEERKNVLSFGLTTFLPPKNIISLYEEKKNNDGIQKVKKYFEKNYDITKYNVVKTQVEREWQKVNKIFFNTLRKTLNLKPLKEYIVQITFYGPGGSYFIPNKIIARGITQNDIEYFIPNIAHEIVHLIVERPIVEKYHLDHEEKENLINYIFWTSPLQKIFPNYRMPSHHKELPRKLIGKINL